MRKDCATGADPPYGVAIEEGIHRGIVLRSDGNGKSDIVWRTINGATVLWEMNGGPTL